MPEMPKTSAMTISELATRAGVHLQTIRFYERQGLLPAPRRSSTGYRQYAPDAVTRVRFIRSAKELGYTLDEIGELLALRVRRGASCARVRETAVAKVAAIDAKAKQLRAMRRVLVRLIDACSEDRAVESCAILGGLEGTR